MRQIPGHRAQATQAVRMHCAASAVTRSARVERGSWRSSLSTAALKVARHLRLCSEDPAIIADTASIPASLMTTIVKAPPGNRVEHDGDENGRSGAHPLRAKLAGHTHERRLKIDGYYDILRPTADLAPDRMPGEPHYSGPVTIAIWAALILASWAGMALSIAIIAAGLEMVLKP